MADENKPDTKAVTPAPVSGDPFVNFVWTILTLLIFLYLINAIVVALISSKVYADGISGLSIWQYFDLLFWKIFGYLKYIMVGFSLLVIGWIILLAIRLHRLRKNEAELLYKKEDIQSPTYANPQWKRISDHVETINESDWKMAIIEADIMLGTLLENMGLPGETIGDKLKAVEKSDFLTVDNAWEAHKVRNQISHEGSTFSINQREAKRVVGLYKTVFEEFKMV